MGSDRCFVTKKTQQARGKGQVNEEGNAEMVWAAIKNICLWCTVSATIKVFWFAHHANLFVQNNALIKFHGVKL